MKYLLALLLLLPLVSCQALGRGQETLLAYTEAQDIAFRDLVEGRITRDEYERRFKEDAARLKEDLQAGTDGWMQEAIFSVVSIALALAGAKGLDKSLNTRRELMRAARHEPNSLTPNDHAT